MDNISEFGELNKDGIFLLDLFVLNYSGIYVFFQVCETTPNEVYLIELATKKYKDGIMLTKDLKASKKPLIIPINNTHTKSNYCVKPVHIEKEPWLPINVEFDSPLYKEAIKRGIEFPITGICYAVPLKDYVGKYWVDRKEERKGANGLA